MGCLVLKKLYDFASSAENQKGATGATGKRTLGETSAIPRSDQKLAGIRTRGTSAKGEGLTWKKGKAQFICCVTFQVSTTNVIQLPAENNYKLS